MEYTYVHRDDLKKWQLATLDIQQDIQTIFEKQGLDCWCGGGTLIGAVRDKGFLYWDNDLDMFFMFKNYKQIILTFLEENIFDRYDLYYFRYGYWQKNENLIKLATDPKTDETLLDFEIEELSNGMFKLFAKTAITIKLYDNNFNKPEQYVKIKHRASEHLTRHRLAYQDDNIVNGATYSVMPNVCMLPMIEMKSSSYLVFLYRFAFSRLFYRLGDLAKYKEVSLDKYCRLRVKPKLKARTGFVLKPTHKYSQKFKVLLNTMIASKVHFFSQYKRKLSQKNSGKFIVYKPLDFRFIVRPYLAEDIFPLKKIEFEDVEINTPNNIHEILKTQFGDYHKAPGIDNRIAYPFFFEDRMD
jgi:phosphorylcholine metabolism protein LicD